MPGFHLSIRRACAARMSEPRAPKLIEKRGQIYFPLHCSAHRSSASDRDIEALIPRQLDKLRGYLHTLLGLLVPVDG